MLQIENNKMMQRVLMMAVLLLGMFLAGFVQAQTSESITFDKGKTSTTISGQIEVDGWKSYVLAAKSGQTLSATIIAPSCISLGEGKKTISYVTESGENYLDLNSQCETLTKFRLTISIKGKGSVSTNLSKKQINEKSLKSAIADLKQKTSVPLRIPTYIVASGKTKFFANAESESTTDSFQLYFDYELGCGGLTACNQGTITGEKLTPESKPNTGIAVKLAKNIIGYFEDFECGASCGDSTITWDENGYRYTAGLKGGYLTDVRKMANSAINNPNVP